MLCLRFIVQSTRSSPGNHKLPCACLQSEQPGTIPGLNCHQEVIPSISWTERLPNQGSSKAILEQTTFLVSCHNSSWLTPHLVFKLVCNPGTTLAHIRIQIICKFVAISALKRESLSLDSIGCRKCLGAVACLGQSQVSEPCSTSATEDTEPTLQTQLGRNKDPKQRAILQSNEHAVLPVGVLRIEYKQTVGRHEDTMTLTEQLRLAFNDCPCVDIGSTTCISLPNSYFNVVLHIGKMYDYPSSTCLHLKESLQPSIGVLHGRLPESIAVAVLQHQCHYSAREYSVSDSWTRTNDQLITIATGLSRWC